MPTKTIYVADEKLWREARKLAGKQGLSGVIAAALKRYVEEKKLEIEGVEEWRFAAGLRGGDRIAFKGKLIASRRSMTEMAEPVWPQEVFDGNDAVPIQIEVFRTIKGTFVVVAELVTDDDTVPVYWAKHQSMHSLKEDQAIRTMDARDRAELLDDISVAGSDDWATWID